MKLSIIIPAYNEEKRILPTLRAYYNFYQEKFKNNFEIIVVPNNCNDDTLNVSQEFAKNKRQVRIHNIPGYVGKGGAVMQGFGLAKGDYAGFSDADNSTDPKNFYKLYRNFEGYDGVIASRKIKGAVIIPRRKFNQDISSYLFNIFVRRLFNLKYKDTQCGAKIFKKDIAKFLAKNYTEAGWAFDVDLLYLCKKNNFKILEFPISWSDAEGSKLTFKESMGSILKIFKYRANNL